MTWFIDAFTFAFYYLAMKWHDFSKVNFNYLFRMNWEMQYCLYLLTNKIFPMQWMLLKLLTSWVFTLSDSATGKYLITAALTWTGSDLCWNLIYFCFTFRYIQSTCATSGEGLYEGLDWLSNNIANKVPTDFFFTFFHEHWENWLKMLFLWRMLIFTVRYTSCLNSCIYLVNHLYLKFSSISL